MEGEPEDYHHHHHVSADDTAVQKLIELFFSYSHV